MTGRDDDKPQPPPKPSQLPEGVPPPENPNVETFREGEVQSPENPPPLKRPKDS